MKLFILAVLIIHGKGLGLNPVFGQRLRTEDKRQTQRFLGDTSQRPPQTSAGVLQPGLLSPGSRNFQFPPDVQPNGPYFPSREGISQIFPSSDPPYTPHSLGSPQYGYDSSTNNRRPQLPTNGYRPQKPPQNSGNSPQPTPFSALGINSLNKAANAVNEFGFNLFKSIGSRNLMLSPLSVSLAMGMVFAGSKGNTAGEMSRVLGYSASNLQENEVHKGFKELMGHLQQNSAGYEMNSANGIFLQDKANVKSLYIQKLSSYYDASIEKADFINKGEETRRRINAWVENATKRKITEFFPRPLAKDTILALVSAVYFKGKWLKPFDRANTLNDVFYNNGREKVTVPMMFRSLKLLHVFDRELEASVLRIPYANSDLEMVIILPEKDSNIETTIRQLNPATFDKVLRNTQEQQIQLGLPKFSLQEQFDLKDVLQSIGIRELFSPSQADLSGISNDGNIFVSRVSHKSKLEVNEEGTEATSVTGIEVVPLSLPQVIKVDHPFLFFIRDSKSKVILFMGYVNQL